MDAAEHLTISQAHPTLTVPEPPLIRLITSACESEGYHLEALGVVLADHETVRRLNVDYLSHDYDTDVLSFPFSNSSQPVIDGEIYVDLDTAQERHSEFGGSFEDEVARYVIHGLLHLMGYTDKDKKSREIMRSRENQYLQDSQKT